MGIATNQGEAGSEGDSRTISKPAYAAFISYRRTDPDSDWAQRLQRFLETYRPPNALGQDAALETRPVFVDTEELAASPNLGEEIESRLLASRKLIVLCSPRSQQSPWVNLEVEFFIKNKGQQNLILFLFDGTPETSFPNPLLFQKPAEVTAFADKANLPLAADPRPTPVYSARVAAKLAFIRVAASILGVEFDTLRQREAQRTQRRRAISAAVLMSIIAVFAIVIGLAINENRKARANTGLAYMASGVTELNSKRYLNAKAIFSRALEYNDSPILRERLATATLHAPTLEFTKKVDHTSEGSSTFSDKFVVRRRLAYSHSESSLFLTTHSGALLKLDPDNAETEDRLTLGEGEWFISLNDAAKKGIAASSAGQLILFALDDLSQLKRSSFDGTIRSIAFATDGNTIFVGATSGLHFIDGEDLTPSSEPITSHAYNVNAITNINDAGIFWAAETRVFHTTNDAERKTDIVLSDTAAVLAIAASSGVICFGGEDRLIYYESTETRHKMEGHHGDVQDIALSTDGSRVASLSADGEIILWRLQSGTVMTRFSFGDKVPASLCFGEENDIVYTLTEDSTLARFKLSANLAPELISRPPSKGAPIFRFLSPLEKGCLAVSNYGEAVEIGTDGSLRPAKDRIAATGVGIAQMSLNKSGTLLAARGHYTKSLAILNRATGEEIVEIDAASNPVWIEEDKLLTIVDGERLAIHALNQGKISTTVVFRCDAGTRISDLVLSPDAKRICVSLSDSTLKVFEADPWKEVKHHQNLNSGSALSITNSGEIAIAMNGKVTLLKGAERINLARGTTVAFSPSGRLLAVGDDQEYLIKVYCVGNGGLLCTLTAHSSPIWALQFTSETDLWSSEFDPCVKRWDISHAMNVHDEAAKALVAQCREETGLKPEYVSDKVIIRASKKRQDERGD